METLVEPGTGSAVVGRLPDVCQLDFWGSLVIHTTLSLKQFLPETYDLDVFEGTLLNDQHLTEDVQTALLRQLTGDETTVLLDFGDLQTLNSITLWYWGPDLLRQLLHQLGKGTPVAAVNCSPRVTHGLQKVFVLSGSPVALTVQQTDGTCSTVGTLSRGLKEVLEHIYQGRQTLRDLELCGVKASSQKLHRLGERCPWTTQRSWEIHPESGVWHHRYRPVWTA